MSDYSTKAYAKINLGLDVVGRRGDGYHLVKMVMQSVGLSDLLDFTRTKDGRISIDSNVDLGAPEDNLIYKAIELIRKEYRVKDGVSVRLTKRIPVAAGLAGGSSDCAATLKAMNAMFGLNLNPEKLAEYGVRLGADVPYCLLGGTALAEGIGEILTPMTPFTGVHVLLVKPDIGISTKAVYHALDELKDPVHPDIDRILAAVRDRDLNSMCAQMGNILEGVSSRMAPVVNEIKAKMLELGADGSMMSGSGPTVFGLFADIKKAEAAFREFNAREFSEGTFLTEFVG